MDRLSPADLDSHFDQLETIASALRGASLAILTGAGCSTESGIPDYRGEGTRKRATSPIEHRAFVSDAVTRQRYWARATIGWRRFATAQPNEAHYAITRLERGGRSGGLITQNVDRLHHRAGTERTIELHGTLSEVRCLDCGAIEERSAVQVRLEEANPDHGHDAQFLPDGDALVDDERVRRFIVVSCTSCGGVLKPNVVFFGDNVSKPVVAASFGVVERADALLVVGSSLTVFSGFRFVREAARARKPIAIVNLGPTRGDDLATWRVSARAGLVMPWLAEALVGA